MSGSGPRKRENRVEATPGLPGFERILADDREDLAAATAQLEALLDRHAVGAEARFNCSLVLEEVVTNIVKYAYDDAGPHGIRFEARLAASHVILRFADDGREFDPSAAPPPDLSRPPDERPIGGLGIHLVRRVADRLEYERKDGHNCLTVCITTCPHP